MATSVEIILCQFGRESGMVEPTLGTLLPHFPGAKVVLISDRQCKPAGVDEVRVVELTATGSPRDGWRNQDYHKFAGLLAAEADVAIALDSDMVAFSDAVARIVPLTLKFGACVPASDRWLVRRDALIGDDGCGLDESGGFGAAMNCSPMTLATGHVLANVYYKHIVDGFWKHPMRGPQWLWRAAWETGFNPYVLPPQWCVCAGTVGIGDEILLHAGHEQVRNYYGLNGLWERARCICAS